MPPISFGFKGLHFLIDPYLVCDPKTVYYGRCNNIKVHGHGGLNYKVVAGMMYRTIGRSILSKVQKMFVPGCFPIHMDPLTSPSEKNSKKIDTSYWSKQAEVLLYDVVYSDFSPIT